MIWTQWPHGSRLVRVTSASSRARPRWGRPQVRQVARYQKQERRPAGHRRLTYVVTALRRVSLSAAAGLLAGLSALMGRLSSWATGRPLRRLSGGNVITLCRAQARSRGRLLEVVEQPGVAFRARAPRLMDPVFPVDERQPVNAELGGHAYLRDARC